MKAIAEGYAQGLNLYASKHPDLTWRGLAPFTAEDIIAGFIFRTPFFYGLDEALLDLSGDERQAQVSLDPGTGVRAWHVGPKSATERGSNAIAVAPIRSGDGTTRLLINSHQPMTGPVAWYEAHLVSEDGLDITGGVFPGSPLILHGFNQDLGWANTVSKPDLVDIYRLTLNPDNQKQYKLGQEWLNFQVAFAPLTIKIFGPFAFKMKRQVLRSVHGPVIETQHGTYAFRYANMGEIRHLEQNYRLNRASSIDAFMEAMAIGAWPSLNYVYADKQGNVAFIHNGQYPVRRDGRDWREDLPGDAPDLIWQDYLPFDQVPKLVNPSSGLVFNANNTPFSATDGSDNLRPDELPEWMGLQTKQTNRSLRLMELTDGSSAIGRDELLALKFDDAYAVGSDADQVIQTVLAHDWSGEPEMAEAAKHLAAWDRRMNKENRHAALGGLTVLREVTAGLTRTPAPDPLTAFRETVQYLTEHHGRLDVPWGDVNRLVRGEINIPIDGGSDTLRAIYPAEIREDGKLHASAGDTWIALVEWDEKGTQSADVIHQFGSATQDSTSPHFADQAPLFAEKRWRKALLNRQAIEADATRRYRPND